MLAGSVIGQDAVAEKVVEGHDEKRHHESEDVHRPNPRETRDPEITAVLQLGIIIIENEPREDVEKGNAGVETVPNPVGPRRVSQKMVQHDCERGRKSKRRQDGYVGTFHWGF